MEADGKPVCGDDYGEWVILYRSGEFFSNTTSRRTSSLESAHRFESEEQARAWMRCWSAAPWMAGAVPLKVGVYVASEGCAHASIDEALADVGRATAKLGFHGATPVAELSEVVRVEVRDHRRLLGELAHAKAQVTALQARMTAMVAERRGDLRARVREFFAVMGQPMREVPGMPSTEHARLGVRLVVEETFELLESVLPPDHRQALAHVELAALSLVDNADLAVDLAALADALADIKYVVEGCSLRFGVDLGPIDAGVHEANMKKRGGPLRESDGKRLKPPGWRPYDVAAEIERQKGRTE